MATNFFELATTLNNLGAKWLSEKKLISRPVKYCFYRSNVSAHKCYIVWKDVLAEGFGQIKREDKSC